MNRTFPSKEDFSNRVRVPTLILENASGDTFSLDPAPLMSNRRPSKVEFISMPDLSNTATLPARIDTGNAGSAIDVAPFSVTRVVWE
jgi:hypothetical protein